MGKRANTVITDMDWALGIHHKLANFSEVEVRRYLAIWALGQKLGVELLPEAYSACNPTALGYAIGLRSNRPSLRSTLFKCESNELLSLPKINSIVRIVIVGLADRATSSERKIEPYTACIGLVRNGLDRSGSNKEQAPPAPPQESQSQPPPDRPEFNVDGMLMGMIRAGWKLRFGSAPHPRMDLFLKRCRQKEISPRAVMDDARQHDPEKPREYVQKLLGREGKYLDDGDETYVEWEDEVIREAEANRRTPAKTTRRRATSHRETPGQARLGDLVQ